MVSIRPRGTCEVISLGGESENSEDAAVIVRCRWKLELLEDAGDVFLRCAKGDDKATRAGRAVAAHA
jgi:hypothetical protein